MTRFLSQALKTKELAFRQEIMNLESANGHPNADIRLSNEIMNNARDKCRELGLDPVDTTSEELYEALQARVKRDDAMLTKRLRTLAATEVSAEADPVAGLVLTLSSLPDTKACFALKLAKLRSLIRALPPRRTMKSIGYRSVESMLKREDPIEILAAAWLNESSAWQKRLLEQYKRLTSADFEDRTIKIIYSNERRYRQLGLKTVQDYHHNIISLKELGAVVLLPLPEDAPAGVVTVSLSLALHELNEIRACSSWLKINQFKPDYGSLVARISLTAPELNTKVFGQPVPWNIIQRYYAELSDSLDDSLFEPYLQPGDVTWQPVEETLSKIEPSLKFWQGTNKLCLLGDNNPISFNLMDNALNLCNKVSFEKRLAHYFQNSLWHELLLRYLKPDQVKEAILNELQPAYAYQEAI